MKLEMHSAIITKYSKKSRKKGRGEVEEKITVVFLPIFWQKEERETETISFLCNWVPSICSSSYLQTIFFRLSSKSRTLYHHVPFFSQDLSRKKTTSGFLFFFL